MKIVRKFTTGLICFIMLFSIISSTEAHKKSTNHSKNPQPLSKSK